MERNYCWWKLFQQTIWNRDISLYLECVIYGIYTRLSSVASSIIPGDPHITRKQLFVVFKSIFKVLKIWKYKQTSICKITGILWHTVYIFTPCAPSQVTLHLLQISTKSHKTRFRDNNFVHVQFSALTKTVVQSVKFTRRKCWRCRICSGRGGKGGILGFLSQNYTYFLECPSWTGKDYDYELCTTKHFNSLFLMLATCCALTPDQCRIMQKNPNLWTLIVKGTLMENKSFYLNYTSCYSI